MASIEHVSCNRRSLSSISGKKTRSQYFVSLNKCNTQKAEVKSTNYCSSWRWKESLAMDFCKNSSLHGLKYIGERRQHFVERIFWTVAFAIGLVVACVMISNVWKKYKSNSVIITFAPYQTKIDELPFPAVTICNMNKILKSKAIKIWAEAEGSNDSKEKWNALENMYYLNHVCSTSYSFSKLANYSSFRGRIEGTILENANMNVGPYDGGKKYLRNFFKFASPPCRDMVLKCMWQKEVYNCTEMFTPMETDNGKCCTFNMVPASLLHRSKFTKEDSSYIKEWAWSSDSLAESHKNPAERQVYPDFPRRQKIPGQSFGLSILLNPGLEEYFCTASDSFGFKMTAHSPIDVPHTSDFGLAIKPNAEVFVNIRPEVTIADRDSIASFSPAQRKCYFDGEKELGYYAVYTAKNCVDECMANWTYEECHCRRHYQPGDDSKPLCGPKEFHCASNIKRKLIETYKTRCRSCIPTCNEIQYHTETTYTPLQGSDVLWRNGDGSLAHWGNKSVSIVHIFFGEESTNAKLRKELYGVIDLVANFGGLMGLCLGFSGLSLVELIYFFTLRAWCRIGTNWTGKDTRERRSLERTDTMAGLLDCRSGNNVRDILESQRKIDGKYYESRRANGSPIAARGKASGVTLQPKIGTCGNSGRREMGFGRVE